MELDPALEERIWAIVNRLRARVGGEEAPDARGGAQAGARPRGAVVLEPVGTAPGFLLGSSPLVAVLPGPPRELQTMWADAGDDRAAGRVAGLARATLEQRILRFFGLPEPQIAATLRELDADALPLEITTCLRRGELEVATVFTPEADVGYDVVRGSLRERHGDVLFSADGATIDEVVARLLAADDRDRRVVHGRADGGPADRPRRVLGVRAGRARRVLQRGQDGAGGRRPPR